jgi:1,4-dihydroxy-6-naphthoate synthase
MTQSGSPLHLVRVGHSPDPDDAFMFHALVNGKIDTEDLRFEQIHQDIETLNRRALAGELEVTAISIHAYAHLAERYRLLQCGASMGDGYGPRIVAGRPLSREDLRGIPIAVPGRMTSAYLALGLYLGGEYPHEVVPFDQILERVADGTFQAGLLIHEGQLTYADHGLEMVADLGEWWGRENDGLPLPLGANAVRGDLPPDRQRQVQRLLLRSIDYALEHRAEALDYAGTFGRGLDPGRTDEFVAMYVNDWTRDLGERGRLSVRRFLDRGHEAGFLPRRVAAEFVDSP